MSARSSPRKLRSAPKDSNFHSNSLVEYQPFGYVCRCTRQQYEEISILVRNCQTYLPFLTFRSLSTVAGGSNYQNSVNRLFPALPSLDCSARAYSYLDVQTTKLQELSRQLSAVAQIKSSFICRISHHRALPSDNLALVVLGNLKALLVAIRRKKVSMETSWWTFLDKNPEKAKTLLNGLMSEIRSYPENFWKAHPNINFHDFATLAPGRWLNDEIINHFIDKWCSQKRNTLGFSTFFAGICLFQDKTSCLVAKNYLTSADENRVRRFIKRRQEMLSLKAWDAVFIPVHEASSHWYSVRIDFNLKRIDIFDSLRETCLVNRQKPVPQRKNTNLMLVLMWLTEILADIRGETLSLTDPAETDRSWVCDPHAKVPFQPNAYDCGVHTLWHLKHILEYRSINLGSQSKEDSLAFSEDMGGKRFRLAQELLQDLKL
ncbi:hypothetical protein EV361DRAFT_955321 [Lentinula raphanica]|nr:hypothetical protein EV361DRAFT_955321 [Lentinula raphanica]